MKKLFKLKEWFTLEETARRLTSSFEEEISVADCLSLALDGRIVISTLLDRSLYVIRSSIEKTTMRKQFNGLITSVTADGAYLNMLSGEVYYSNAELDYQYDQIKRNGNVFRLDFGIYDLPMLGAERLDVMHQFDLEQHRSPREYINIEGPFLITKYGMVNVLESFNELTLKFDGKESRLFDPILDKYVDFKNHSAFFYPDDGLGEVEFVFRRENIELFEQSVLNNEEPTLNLDSSLLIIGSVLNALKKAQPTSKRWTQEAIKNELENICPIKPRDIDNYFSEANKRFKSIG
ncbi:hypothetical protein RGJ02_003263 [Morganella morganii]|nr:hypothetical protein [Morganella morganii]